VKNRAASLGIDATTFANSDIQIRDALEFIGLEDVDDAFAAALEVGS
jgi:hypothetical protein